MRVSADEIKKIANELKINENNVEAFDELFQGLNIRMKDKYLSHLVAVCEDIGRKFLNNQEFCIDLRPRYTLTEKDREVISTSYNQETVKSKNDNFGRINKASQLIRSRHKRSNREDSHWDILYPASQDNDTKEMVLHKRIAIAHEIGHLIVFLLGKSGKYKEYDLLKSMLTRSDEDKKKVEQFCDFFAILAISNREEFYKSAGKKYIHDDGIEGNIALLKKYKDLKNY